MHATKPDWILLVAIWKKIHSFKNTTFVFSKFNEFGKYHGDAPESKIHGDNMGPTWVLLAPGGSHIGPMNLAMLDYMQQRIW